MPSITLNHSPSSVDHSSLKPRQGYNLLTSIFFSGSHCTNKHCGNSASPSESPYYAWEFPGDFTSRPTNNSRLLSHGAAAIFFARFSAFAGPHRSINPHERMNHHTGLIFTPCQASWSLRPLQSSSYSSDRLISRDLWHVIHAREKHLSLTGSSKDRD